MAAFRRTSIVAVCAILAACASGSRAGSAVQEREATYVLVDNQAVLDMTVYALRGSQRIRLGTATGLSRTRFTLPRGIVFGATSLRFLADPIGSSRTPVSQEITVSEGEEIELRIPPA